MIGWGSDEEEVMELLWQNGQVVMKSQGSHRKPSPSSDHGHPLDLIPSAAVRGGSLPPYYHHHDPSIQQQQNDADNNNLFIQEDEMSTWLLSDFCSDLLLPAATSAVQSRPARPPPAVPPPKRFDSFGHFSRLNRPRAATTADEATVVDSSDTPMVARASDDAARRDIAQVGAQSTSAGVRDATTRDLTMTSSSGASSASSEPITPAKSREFCPPKMRANVPDERKRKARDGEDVEPVPNDAKRVLQGSSSTKKSRSSEVHNLSERRRRDRINEKMRALQVLIPHCNKADKASLLDEAIGYLKSLQMQVQMMSMGCGMMPMMYPGVQQYMPHMGMGMNRPMIHFPNVMLPTPGARPHMGPTFRFPGFQMPPHIPAPDLSRMPPTNQPDAMLSSSSHHDSNSPRMPGFMDPYHQFLGLQHMHLPFQQSQANTSSSGKPTTSKAGEISRKESPD